MTTKIPSTSRLTSEMQQSVDATQRKLAGLRVGRAHPDLLASISVEAWGSHMPLNQVAQIGVQPPRALVVSPHDPSLVAGIEKAINNSDLGARAQVDGARIRINLPEPSDDQRKQLARKAKEAAEAGRVAIRLARRDAINTLKRARAAEEISEAKLNGRSKDFQALTDQHTEKVDALLTRTLHELEV